MIPNIANIIPNETTIAAPVGTSAVIEMNIPNKLPKIPKHHPNISLPRIDSLKRSAAIVGIIRNEKTSNTPAIFTELVTTKPNVT